MDPAAGPIASRTPDPGEVTHPGADAVDSKTADKFAYAFYGVAATAALVGQVWAGVKHIPWPEDGFPMALRILLVAPAVGVIELGGVATAALADVRRRKGENAYAYRAMSFAAALVALAFNVIGHWSPGERFLAFGFGGLSAFAYVLWIVHSGARRRDALRATGRMAQTAPVYGIVRWLSDPKGTWLARQLALEHDLGLFESLHRSKVQLRTEKRNKNISEVVARTIKAQHKDKLHADIAVAAYDSPAIAADVAEHAKNSEMARHIRRVIEPPTDAAPDQVDQIHTDHQGMQPHTPDNQTAELSPPATPAVAVAANHHALAVGGRKVDEAGIAAWLAAVQRADTTGEHGQTLAPAAADLSGHQPTGTDMTAGWPVANAEVADTMTEAAKPAMTALEAAQAQIASTQNTLATLATEPQPMTAPPVVLAGHTTGQPPVTDGGPDDPEPPNGPGSGSRPDAAASRPPETSARRDSQRSWPQAPQPAPAVAGVADQVTGADETHPATEDHAPVANGLADTGPESAGHTAVEPATITPSPGGTLTGPTADQATLTATGNRGQTPGPSPRGRRPKNYELARPAMDAWADAGQPVTAARLTDELGIQERTARRVIARWEEERDQQDRENNVVRLTGQRGN